ncbi:hypothetical protein BIW11_01120 [Tropilaelaps mercedesae]|uniref:Large ribosomal subunit protein mL64 n=1 Tax=Tropilaelaps mercedesae TaxID=418985 RepID=A0A1V9XJF3_9ACAR|nr:hypothetical protein BIW11_01120 [Tropilaelaps mercedesae]
MLSMRLVRPTITGASCRSFGRTNVLTASANKISETPTSDTAQPLNIFGEPEGPTEEEITAKRNIARLPKRVYNRKLKGVYMTTAPSDFSTKQLRRDYAEFGKSTGINPGVCWPTKQEMADLHFIDGEFYQTFDQMKERVDARRKEDIERAQAREQEIEANLAKLVVWRKEMLDKEEKKANEELAKKALMDERIREVREYIGYNVEPHDPKFIEVMEMKEQERKAAAKKARKLAKREQIMQRLLNVNSTMSQLDTAKGAEKQRVLDTDSAVENSIAGKAASVDEKIPKGEK